LKVSARRPGCQQAAPGHASATGGAAASGEARAANRSPLVLNWSGDERRQGDLKQDEWLAWAGDPGATTGKGSEWQFVSTHWPRS
jgi:hypothetical protein